MPEPDTPDTQSESRLPRRLERRQRRAKITQRRRRQIQALLAGGLVLGVGATATVAAWTDEEHGVGTFRTGQFHIEANIGGVWQDTDQMQFDADAMFPGEDVYDSVLIRTTPNTTVDGELTVSASGSSDALAPHLNYRVVASEIPEGSDSLACNADSFTADAGYIYGSATGPDVPLTSTLDAAATHTVSANGANVMAYCFHVQLSAEAPNEVQGQSANHTWTWNAESIVPD